MSLAAILERAGLRPQPSPGGGDAQTRMDKGVPSVPKVPSQKYKGACKSRNTEAELVAEREMRRLLAAAMCACDHWGDSDEARQEMKRQCLEVPSHLREELREHFEHNYPGRGRDND